MGKDLGPRASRRSCLPSPSLLDLGERKADPLLEEVSICFFQPCHSSKSACDTVRPLAAPSASPFPHSQLIELSSPENVDGSLPRHRDLEVWGIQDFRGVLAYALSKRETLLSSNSWEHCGELSPKEFTTEGWDNTSPFPRPTPGNLGKLGRLGEGHCILGVWLRISPAQQPRTNQGPLWALGTSCSLLLFQAACTFRMVGQRRFG